MTCYSCKIFDPLQQLSYNYGQQVFSAVAPGALLLFSAFVGVWFVWMLIDRGCFKGELTFENFAKPLLIFSIVTLVLQKHELYWQWFYNPVVETTSSLAQTIMRIGTFEHMTPSITGLLTAMDSQLMKIFNIGSLIISDTGFYQIGLMLGALVMLIPFVFVWGIFLAYILEGTFKLLAVTAISPLLIVAGAFSSTRGFMTMGMRVVLDGCLTVVLAAVAMGFTLSVAQSIIGAVTTDGVSLRVSSNDFIFSGEYWILFILGFVSVLFHLKAATIASNISGAQDGPGAAAAVVSTSMAAAGTALRFTGRRMGIVASNLKAEFGKKTPPYNKGFSAGYDKGQSERLSGEIFQGSGNSGSNSQGPSASSGGSSLSGGNKGMSDAFGI